MSSKPNIFIIILISILCLISLYLVLQPLQQQQTNAIALQVPKEQEKIKYDESLGYKVVNKQNRNLSELFYTQGFKFKNSDIIAESAGLYGESEIHYMDAKDLKIIQRTKLQSKYFGEGCAFYTNSQNEREIHQMTWRERKVIIYNADTLEQKRIVDLPQQMSAGWGLATIESQEKGKSQFLATDGSSYLFYISPEDWSVVKSFKVHDDMKKPISMLNDLEVVEDKILINIYLTTRIIELKLETGEYVRSYEFKQLKDEVFDSDYFMKNSMDNQYCLNGIAYDKKNKKVLITGKKWPFIYEIKFDNQVNKAQ